VRNSHVHAREPTPPAAAAEEQELSPDELAAQQIVDLPQREAMSVVSATTALAVGATAHAGLLPDPVPDLTH